MDLVCSLLSNMVSDTDIDDTSDTMQSEHEKTLAKILSRRRHFSDRTLYKSYSLSANDNDLKTLDSRWISSENLLRPWHHEDKWWLSSSHLHDCLLDTSPRVFGRKKVFLIERK